MLRWSINLFRIRGIQLAVHGSFFLLLAWWGYRGWIGGGAAGVGWSVATLLTFFGCVVLHELGHSFTALHFGIGVHRILLMPIGGMAEFDAIPRQPARELLITLAGPAVNFVIAGLLWLPASRLPEEFLLYSFHGFLYQVFVANLAMGCFNLLPAFPMDGGRIFRAVLAWRRPYLQATRWAATVGKVVCVIGGGLALWNQLWLPAVLFTFIFFAGEAEYRAVRRRELEDAHWRATVARLHAPEDVAMPPILRP